MIHICDRCADLEAENADLRKELGYEIDRDRASRARESHGFTRMEAALVAALCGSNGRTLSESTLDMIMPTPSGRDREDPHFVRVLVYRVRKKLGRDSIANVWGEGYRAGPALIEAFAPLSNITLSDGVSE